jgi:hypothetical protein
MAKAIIIKLKKAGSRLSVFSISDDMGNILASNVPKSSLISGFTVSVGDGVKVITLASTGINCCNKSWNLPIVNLDIINIAAIEFQQSNTASLWRHLTNPTIYNKFYDCVQPYVIEYPFSYQYYDEILQNIKDYSKVYRYLPSTDGVFNDNQKVETDQYYFNKAILYNGQQSSGVLELVSKPINNLSQYLKYPLYNTDSKTITFTKSGNFYQYNTFWSLVKNKSVPLFLNSCQSMSVDKIVNQANMDYSKRSFKKVPLMAKELKIRHILDSRSDVHLVSQFIIGTTMISYK